MNSDATGVSCHLCHNLTNPDGTERPRVQNPPFLAHDGGLPPEGYRGSSMFTLLYDDVRLGPYDDADASHSFAKSEFHRSSEFCGTCHDVSNPVTGDLAHNNGAPVPLATGTFSGVLGSPVDGKPAFNNLQHAHGVVERTFSEHMASAFPDLSSPTTRTCPLSSREVPSRKPGKRRGSERGPRTADERSTHSLLAVSAQGVRTSPTPGGMLASR